MGDKFTPVVGDKIIITKSKENWADAMDHYVGNVYTIAGMSGGDTFFQDASGRRIVEMEEYFWSFDQRHYKLFEKADRKTLKLNFKL